MQHSFVRGKAREAVGAPARVVRRVSARDLAYIQGWVKKYVRLAKAYRERC